MHLSSPNTYQNKCHYDGKNDDDEDEDEDGHYINIEQSNEKIDGGTIQ